MGLGKTLQTIALIHTVHTQFESLMRTALVICPVNTVKNWEHEFEKWLPGDLELEVHEMSVERDNWGRADRLGMWRREGGVMIMGYDMFRNLTNDQTKKFTKKQKAVFKESLVDPGPGKVCTCTHTHTNKQTNKKSCFPNILKKKLLCTMQNRWQLFSVFTSTTVKYVKF